MINLITLLAQDPIGTIGRPDTRFTTSSDANSNIANIVSIFLATATVIGGLIFMVMLVLGGVRWLTAGGDKAALEAAKNMITNAAIGLALIVGAVAITFVVQTALGINILTPRLGQ